MASTIDKVKSREALKKLVDDWKSNGLKVVFTNGCFDLMHLGHIDYLEKASKLGDKMVVAVNSDQSVSTIKGPDRPITNETSRSRIMAALEFVDAVTLFNDETPRELITYLMPDILVKGSDYSIENIAGAKEVIENGGSVKTIDLVSGYSTSDIIAKIQNTKSGIQ